MHGANAVCGFGRREISAAVRRALESDISGRPDIYGAPGAGERIVTRMLERYGRDPVERYAYARVGYHRGLDTLRATGWRGSGYVRWRHESNRGFLRALEGLRAAAAEIGEVDEEERCAHFLRQCDPQWPPVE